MKSLLYILLCTFIFFTFLKPAGFDIMGMDDINTFFNIARICFAPLIVSYYLKIFHRLSTFVKAELLFVFVLFIPTYLYNPEELNKCFIWSISIILFSCLVEVLVEKNYKILIYSLFINYLILIIGNLFWMISFVGGYVIEAVPDNSFSISFLASDNMTASYIFPALSSAFLLSVLARNRYNVFALLLYVAIILSVLMLWSATSLSGVFLLIFYIYFIYGSRLEHYVKSRNIIIVSCIIVIGVTFFNIQKFFSFIIVDILHKDLTMTGRTEVWKNGLNGFQQSPLLGCGFGSDTIDSGLVQVLFNGGIVWMLAYLFLLKRSCQLFLGKYNNSLSRYFAVSIAVIILMHIAESWPTFSGLYVILSLSVNSDKLSWKLQNS